MYTKNVNKYNTVNRISAICKITVHFISLNYKANYPDRCRAICHFYYSILLYMAAVLLCP